MEINPTLVALGCSLTYGQGCWGDFNKKIFDINEIARLRIQYFGRSMEYGWPNLIAKDLGFKKLINLGRPGSSTSGQLKLFMEQDFTGQDVYIVWMLTTPVRFSFYKKGSIENINPIHQVMTELGQSYINFINSESLDPCLEQLFYVKCMRDICRANNYKLILTYWNPSSILTQALDSNKSNYLTSKPENINAYDLEHISKVCNHPNEKGYQYIANKIISYIDLNYKSFRVGESINKVNISFPMTKIFTSGVHII